MGRTHTVAGVRLEIDEQGSGRPLLFLHPGEGAQAQRPWIEPLARHFRVIVPHHPGFGGSDLPDWIGTVDDLSYLYLDLLRDLDLSGVLLAGNSFGGWIAAEMAVRDTRRLAGLVLADPLGIKVGGVLDRDIVDMHGTPRDEVMRLSWADPARGAVDYASLPDTELAAIARGREAVAVFGWKPYMHNPRLRRWQDRIVTQSYVQGWLSQIPGATLGVIDDAGHYPQWEQPAAFAAEVAAFAATLPASGA